MTQKVEELAEKIKKLSPEGQLLVQKVLEMCIQADKKAKNETED